MKHKLRLSLILVIICMCVIPAHIGASSVVYHDVLRDGHGISLYGASPPGSSNVKDLANGSYHGNIESFMYKIYTNYWFIPKSSSITVSAGLLRAAAIPVIDGTVTVELLKKELLGASKVGSFTVGYHGGGDSKTFNNLSRNELYCVVLSKENDYIALTGNVTLK